MKFGERQSVTFANRREAGRRLAAALERRALERPVVLALPRGGVPVAFEVARALGAPLDVCVVRKVGVPWHPELGMGAVAEGGFVHIGRDVVDMVGVSEPELSAAIEQQRIEVEERIRKFRGGRVRTDVRDRTVILVDDGIATGGTVRAAIRAVRAENPKRLVLAVPVAAEDTIRDLAPEVDAIVCLLTPSSLYAIGVWYEDFAQVSDDEVVELLERARQEQTRSEDDEPTREKRSHADCRRIL